MEAELYVALYIQTYKICILKFQKNMKQIFWDSQCWVLQTGQNINMNYFIFRLHKNDKIRQNYIVLKYVLFTI
jgi:hypothetical protein